MFRFAHRSFVTDDLVVFLAVYLPVILVLAAFAFVCSQKGMRKKLFLTGELLIAVIVSRGVVTEAIRFFFPHPRPPAVLGVVSLFTDTASSFPSGHAAVYFALATVLFFWNKKWGTWFFVLAAVNGIARVVAGVHWPFDIVGGAVVGILSALLIHRALAREKAALEGGAVS